MPRNDQIIRQWHLLRLLESSSGLTMQEMADRLPADYLRHHRTVRRDIEALEAVGFPLVNDRVDGQVRWRLMDGFHKIPAMSFSPTELMALVLSRSLLKPLEGTQVQAALDSALQKAAAVLPPASHEYLQQIQSVFAVGLGPHKQYREHRQTIDLLTQAIDKHRTVQMRYFSGSRQRTTRREVDPYRLWYAAGGLYLIGYCHLRKEPRMFAVERIKSITPTDHPYQLPLGFNLEAFVQDALTVMRGPRINVELLFDKATAVWAHDRTWHPSQEVTLRKDGRMIMTLQVADTRELLGWILSFGGGVQVRKPERLQQAVKDEAKKLLVQQ